MFSLTRLYTLQQTLLIYKDVDYQFIIKFKNSNSVQGNISAVFI